MSRSRSSAPAAARHLRPLHLMMVAALIAGASICFVVSAASATPPKGPPNGPPQGPPTTPNPPPPAGTNGTNPPATVTGVLITRRPGTLKRGSRVGASSLFGHRVYLNAKNGFALATVGGADYPVRTTDGGHTWRTDGPSVHLDAAQAPLAVSDAGAANKHTFYACCGAQVVDATIDNGKHWWQAFLGDVVLAVTSRPGGKLIAIAQTSANSTGSKAATWVYTSKDGGHHWQLDSKEGAF